MELTYCRRPADHIKTIGLTEYSQIKATANHDPLENVREKGVAVSYEWINYTRMGKHAVMIAVHRKMTH